MNAKNIQRLDEGIVRKGGLSDAPSTNRPKPPKAQNIAKEGRRPNIMNYGKELILDLHNCKNTNLFNRKDLTRFFKELCELIDMERCDLHFWDYVGEEEEYVKAPIHLKGTSAIQFISTSNITVHTLDEMERVYLNIFSCKNFSKHATYKFCIDFFDGEAVNVQTIRRV